MFIEVFHNGSLVKKVFINMPETEDKTKTFQQRFEARKVTKYLTLI